MKGGVGGENVRDRARSLPCRLAPCLRRRRALMVGLRGKRKGEVTISVACGIDTLKPV